MSTAIYPAPTNKGVFMQHRTTDNLPDLARKIRALRALSTSTGYSLNRTIGEMLDKLTPEQLITLGEMFITSPDEENNNK